jgi:glucose/arabinose dehydrogenase
VLHHQFATAARRSRIQIAVTVTALALIVGAGPAAGTANRPTASTAAAPAAYDPNAVNVGWTKVISGLSKPVLVTDAGDGSGRLFVVQQGGKIRVFKGGSLLAAPFLDLTANVLSTGFEQGLLGLAFHPSFETNGKFYVYFTLKSNGAQVVNEYRVAAPYTADTAAWQTGRRILTMTDPYSNHNGGHMAFGADGYLYIGTGDGGSAGDPGNRAQSTTSLLGKMLRLDINGTANGKQYRVPATNPYVGIAGWDEIWAIGLRNPWGWSFDRANGDLWIADVGQNRYEEIDVSRASAGVAGRKANYGWRQWEGRHCYNPSTGCSATGKTMPVSEYFHDSGNCSVTGGYVYRGTAYPALVGGYFFADYCSGKLWSIAATSTWPATRVQHVDSPLQITSFGEDEFGNVYIVFQQGYVYRLTGTPKP